MFFRANGERVPCGFPSEFSYDIATGMTQEGEPSSDCNGWHASDINTNGAMAGYFFDRGPDDTPPEPAADPDHQVWERCTDDTASLNDFHVMLQAIPYASCGSQYDGLLCVRVQ